LRCLTQWRCRRGFPRSEQDKFIGAAGPDPGRWSCATSIRMASFAQPISVTSSINLRDHEHFRVQATSSVDRLFIGKPFILRLVNKPAIQFTRSMVGPDGAFAGVVAVSLDPSYVSRNNPIMPSSPLIGERISAWSSLAPARQGRRDVGQPASSRANSFSARSRFSGIGSRWMMRRIASLAPRSPASAISKAIASRRS
jgi:hypothetical protein